MIRSPFSSLAIGALLVSSATAQFFTPGNVVVVRVGDPSLTLGSTAAQVFLEEWDPVGGTFVQQVEIPNSLTAAVPSFSQRGFSSSEGQLTLTQDGRYLLVGGYDRNIGDSDPTAEPASTTPRVIARIDTLIGTIDTSTALVDAYDGGAIRGVASDDGSRFWTSGDTTGALRFVANLGASASVGINAGAPSNLRFIGIDMCNLFVTSAATSSMTLGPLQVGPGGLPTTSGQTLTLLPGFPGGTQVSQGSPYDFWFADANTIYVADSNTNSTIGGVQKWTLSGGTWTFQYRLTVSTSAIDTWGARGLHGIKRNGVNEIVFTAEQSGFFTYLCHVADTGPNAVPTVITMEAAQTDLRGVRFVGAQFSRTAAGCSQADIRTEGPGLVGTDLRTEVCNPAGFPLINYSFSGVGLPLAGCGCTVVAAPGVIVAGPTSTLPIPNNPSLAGVTLIQQGIDFLDPASTCTLLPFLTLTDGISVTIL